MERGLGNLLARAVLAGVQQNRLQSLQLQLLAGEVKDGVELFEPYGLTGHALPGAEAAVAFIDGSRTHGIALVQTDRRYRPVDLAPGEVALFNHEGTCVVLRNGGRIEMTAATEVAIQTGRLALTGDLDVIGATTFTGSVSANGHAIDETHRHELPGGSQTLEVV
ncbi:phage baseplate assembly protein V [Stutzerimonas stutzeri]|nr:phage baseplate assembly protein V [Stutzerimonas stutzeri]